MPIQINEGVDENFLTVHVSGILAKTDYASFEPEFERLVGQHGKLHLLFDMTGFQGLDAGAMVGDKQWQHFMTVISKPFMKATIQYFDHSGAAKARKWLAQG